MLLLVAKRKLPYLLLLPLPCFTANKTFLLPHPPPSCFSASATQSPDPKPHFMVGYLITSCGFSPDKAARLSKPLSHLKSPEKPDSVLRFLKHQGFDETHIEILITWHPRLLYASPEKTLEPNLRALRDMGLSSSALTELLLASPGALHLRSAVPRIKFWRDFLGGDEEGLIKAFKQNKGLIGHDIGRIITPKFSLLQKHGFSDREIGRILRRVPRFITSSVGSMETLLKRAKELGFRPESGMFVPGLHAVTCVSRDMFQKKMELLKIFGWSEEEFLSALRKAPTMVMLSEKNLRAKMDFLVGEAWCDPSYIASHPAILPHSLENRLRPRCHVLRILESKALAGKRQDLLSAVNLPDRKFVERYLLPHMGEIPELHEAYLAACASRIPITYLEK